MYHRVDPDRPADAVGRDLTVTPAHFEAQLRALERDGIRAISVHDFIVRLREGEPLGKLAVLTFDDGYGDQYRYAVPLLRKYHANASFYIVTGNVGTPRHLTWPQIAAMRRSGFDIAAHGVSHDDLSLMDARAQEAQIRGSLASLRAHAQDEADSYAYPSGRFNAQTLRIVRGTGVAIALTTDPAFILAPETRFEISRVRVHGDWDAASFRQAIQAAQNRPHIVKR